MLIRDIVGTTIAGLTAAALALAPGLFQAPAPGSPGTGAASAGSRGPVETAPAFVHPCPETTESECRAVFLPPLADNDSDGEAHTSHQPQVRICGPLDQGVSIQSVSSCDDAGTGEEVEFFPFACGNPNDCVKVTGNHFHANWHIPTGGEEDDDEGDDDEDDGDEDDEDDEADDGEEIENGFYLINVRLNGNSAGGVVIEVGGAAGGGGDDDDDSDDDDDGDTCTGGTGVAPFYCVGDSVPIKFRLHDKIVG